MNRRSSDRMLRSNPRSGSLVSPPPDVPKKKKRSTSKPKGDIADTYLMEQDKEPTKQIEQPAEPVNLPSHSDSDKTTNNRKKHDALEHGGYIWHHNKTTKTAKGETSYYDCSQLRGRACKVKLTVKKTTEGCSYKENDAKHTHIIDARDKMAKDLLKEALEKAKSTDKSTRELYAETLSGAPEEVVSRMPKADTFGKSVRTVRNGECPKAPQTMAELVLPKILTNSGSEFIMFDNQDEKNRIIMFSTQEAMDFLASCKTLFMDGTVETGPVLFDQVYTIHGALGKWRMPLVYTLCTNKKTSTYKTILRQLKRDQPDYSPDQINIDFELAAMNAAKEVFPETKIQYCYFHLKQSVIRNLASNGLKERYAVDTKFAKEILQMVSVAFLPVDEVIPAWEKFIELSLTLNKQEQANDPNIDYFVNEYFCKYYIGLPEAKGGRKRARFPVHQWNVHESTLNDQPRTNNVAEGWHNAFSTMTGAKRPTIFKFLKGLKKDEAIARGKIIDCNAEKQPKPQKRCYAERDEAVKSAVLKYLEKRDAAAKIAAENAAAELEDEDDADSDDDMDEDEQPNSPNQWSRSKTDRSEWLKTPVMMLLNAIASNCTID